MRCSGLALILAFVGCGQAAVLRGHTESVQLQERAALSQASELESEDRSFLLAQLDETESELKKLQQFVELLATPIDKKAVAAAKPAVKMAETKKAPAPATKKQVAKYLKVAKDLDPTVAAASMLKGVKNAASLAPMLAMLKGLYAESKERISEQNVREDKSKKWFAGKEADHKAKLAKIEGSFANHTLSEEFRTNETRDETRYFTYWQRCRERQHRQFHTNLKIQHAMMTKVKGMIKMYEKALSPKASDQSQAKKQLGQMTGMPEIVLLQNFDDVKKQVVQFCSDTLSEVWKVREELHQDSDLQQQLAGEGLNEFAATLLAHENGMTY